MRRIHFDSHDVHIAVCGTSGSGISSFVNAFCGLRDVHDDPARVGVTQCTSEITRYWKLIELAYYYPLFSGSRLWLFDVPGAGTVSSPAGEQYFNDQGLFVFDALVLVYDARFSRSDMEIIKASIRFNVPVFVVRSKSDQHIASMIRDETGAEPGDKDSYNEVYGEMADKYVQATRSEWEGVMTAMARDPEMDLRDRELLLKQRVYIWSSKKSKSQAIDEDLLSDHLWNFVETEFDFHSQTTKQPQTSRGRNIGVDL